jgi:hypothetical protein
MIGRPRCAAQVGACDIADIWIKAIGLSSPRAAAGCATSDRTEKPQAFFSIAIITRNRRDLEAAPYASTSNRVARGRRRAIIVAIFKKP